MPMLNAARNVELPLLLTNLSKKQRNQSVATALELVGLADPAEDRAFVRRHARRHPALDLEAPTYCAPVS